ncbi:MAG: hypothetical protein Q4F67_15830, partial [Propionibacteriaceae bacterium]|nr:hypothetical protein [Propionibacteriaceae bacterium]
SPATPTTAASPATPTATPTPTRDTRPGTPRLLRLTQPGGTVDFTATSTQRSVDALRPRAEGHDLVIDPASFSQSPEGWPLHRVSYQILCSAGQRADLGPLERDWLHYLVADETQNELADEGRLALPPAVRDQVRAAATGLS